MSAPDTTEGLYSVRIAGNGCWGLFHGSKFTSISAPAHRDDTNGAKLLMDQLCRELNAGPRREAALRLVQRGLQSGHMKSKPILDRSDPNAAEWPVLDLYEVVTAALSSAKAALGAPQEGRK